MTRLPRNAIAEIRETYIKTLDRWIGLPVWHEEDLFDMLGQFDLADVELVEYKERCVRQLAGIQTEDPKVIDEVYKKLLRLNKLLHPSSVWRVTTVTEQSEVMSDQEKQHTMRAFAGRIKSAIKVIHDTIKEDDPTDNSPITA